MFIYKVTLSDKPCSYILEDESLIIESLLN